MNASTDERFFALAIKVAANRATAQEQAELEAILAAEPPRQADFKRVQENTKLAVEHAPTIYEASTDVPPLPEKYRVQMHRRLAEVLGPPQIAAPVQPKELSANEMKVLVLKVIAERSMDGFELAQCLEKAALKLKGAGEGAIYGLLVKLEASGHLEGRWREQGARMIKTYHLTDKGTGLLEAEKGMAGQLNAWSQAVLAFDPSQS